MDLDVAQAIALGVTWEVAELEFSLATLVPAPHAWLIDQSGPILVATGNAVYRISATNVADDHVGAVRVARLSADPTRIPWARDTPLGQGREIRREWFFPFSESEILVLDAILSAAVFVEDPTLVFAIAVARLFDWPIA